VKIPHGQINGGMSESLLQKHTVETRPKSKRRRAMGVSPKSRLRLQVNRRRAGAHLRFQLKGDDPTMRRVSEHMNDIVTISNPTRRAWGRIRQRGVALDCGKGRWAWGRIRQRGVALDCGKGRRVDGASLDCGKGRRAWGSRRQRGAALDYGKGRRVDGVALDYADRT
jgi:hypothetical protein